MKEGREKLTTPFPHWFLIIFLLKSEGGEGGAPHTICILIFLLDSYNKVKEGREELTTPFPFWFLIRFLSKREEKEGVALHTISLLISYQILIKK